MGSTQAAHLCRVIACSVRGLATACAALTLPCRVRTGQYFEGQRPWGVDTKYDVAIPGATQNEIELEDAKALVKAGAKIVLEGANMPSTSDAIEHFHKNKVDFGCAKVRVCASHTQVYKGRLCNEMHGMVLSNGNFLAVQHLDACRFGKPVMV